jgi:hypothetical protein
MKQISIILSILSFLFNNAFALVASDIDSSNANSDLTLLVASVVSLLILMYGYKKVMSLLSR